MGGYAIRVNHFLSLTLSLIISVTSACVPTPFLPLRFFGPTLPVPRFLPPFPTWPVRFAPLCPLSGWSPETANTWHACGSGLARPNPQVPLCVVEDVQDAWLRWGGIGGWCGDRRRLGCGGFRFYRSRGFVGSKGFGGLWLGC